MFVTVKRNVVTLVFCKFLEVFPKNTAATKLMQAAHCPPQGDHLGGELCWIIYIGPQVWRRPS